MMNQVSLPAAVCSGMLACLALGFATEAAEPTVQGPEETQLTDRLAAFKLQQLAVPDNLPDKPFDVQVTIGDEPVRLQLHSHSLRADDFKVLVQGDGPDLEEHALPPVATFRGSVAGVPGSVVSGSLIEGRLTAAIELAPDDLYVVEPAPEDIAAADGPPMHISYRVDSLAPSDYTCGVDTDQLPQGPMAAGGGGGGADGTGLQVAEIALDADYHFYLSNGSSVSATLLNVETVMNTVEFIYERDTEISYEITVIVVRTSLAGNPYTTSDPFGLLCQFRDVWNSSPEVNIRRDTAQLFSGRAFIGTTLGVAWVGTVCNVGGFSGDCASGGSLAYSVVETNFPGGSFNERVALSAHEIGHNWNALHCGGGGCHIMCSSLGGCGGIFGPNLKFGALSQSQIEAFRDTRACLLDLPTPLLAPVLDEFPSTTIDSDIWTWFDPSVVIISEDGVGEPSPPNSIRLRSFGGTEYRDGEVRSNFINLEGESDLVVSYFAQNQGVESGEQLFVEYWHPNLNWTLLNVINSPGVEFDFYLDYEHELPAAAYHQDFRLRFHMDGDDFDDMWFIDDVYVGPPVVVEDCPEDLDGDGSVGFADLLEVLSFWGPCADCDADIDGDGTVGFADLLQLLSAWGPCP